jgi:hypothetical protein
MRRLAVLLALPLVALVSCGGDGADFCEQATAFDEQFAELEEQFDGDELPTAEAFEQAAAAIDDLADDAPEEIEGDMRTVSGAVREIAEIFGEIDLSDPEALTDPANAGALAELNERMESLGGEVEEASNRVEAYLEEECDISVDDEE